MKRKVILVGFMCGRVGSSMVMGLLKMAGASVGNVMPKKDKHNRKGYFEIAQIQACQESMFKPMFFWGSKLIPIVRAYEQCEKARDKWPALLDKNFGDAPVITFKARMFAIAPLFIGLGYDVRLLWIRRNTGSQVRSMARIGHHTNVAGITAWVEHGLKWMVRMVRQLPFPVKVVYMEQILARPVQTAAGITAFCGLHEIPAEKVKAWVDRTMVTS
jgi:hypothetical protein